ncbi:MAG: hypothetical protein AB7L09_25820 [Nitrospira sp.]
MPRKALANAPAALWFASRRAAKFQGRHLEKIFGRADLNAGTRLPESRFVKRRVPSIRSKKLRRTETTGND